MGPPQESSSASGRAFPGLRRSATGRRNPPDPTIRPRSRSAPKRWSGRGQASGAARIRHNQDAPRSRSRSGFCRTEPFRSPATMGRAPGTTRMCQNGRNRNSTVPCWFPCGPHIQIHSSAGRRRCDGNHPRATCPRAEPGVRSPSAPDEAPATPSPSANLHRTRRACPPARCGRSGF